MFQSVGLTPSRVARSPVILRYFCHPHAFEEMGRPLVEIIMFRCLRVIKGNCFNKDLWQKSLSMLHSRDKAHIQNHHSRTALWIQRDVVFFNPCHYISIEHRCPEGFKVWLSQRRAPLWFCLFVCFSFSFLFFFLFQGCNSHKSCRKASVKEMGRAVLMYSCDIEEVKEDFTQITEMFSYWLALSFYSLIWCCRKHPWHLDSSWDHCNDADQDELVKETHTCTQGV